MSSFPAVAVVCTLILFFINIDKLHSAFTNRHRPLLSYPLPITRMKPTSRCKFDIFRFLDLLLTRRPQLYIVSHDGLVAAAHAGVAKHLFVREHFLFLRNLKCRAMLFSILAPQAGRVGSFVEISSKDATFIKCPDTQK